MASPPRAKGAAKNCVPLIRTGFELQLGVMFMLERNEDCEKRYLAYEFFHYCKQLKVAMKCDPKSEAGKQVRAQIRGELLADGFDHPERDIQLEIDSLQQIIDHPRYAAVKADYELNQPRHWYGMWNGPTNLERLAKALDRQSRYEMLYRYWSGHAHGESALNRMFDSPECPPRMEAIRTPKGLPTACLHACNLANELAVFLRDRFVPHLRDEMGRRYLNQIKPGIDYINSVRGLER